MKSFHSALSRGETRRIAGSSYVLVEFDFAADFNDIHRGLRNISERGYTPILAHFERYGCLREAERSSDIKRLGVVMQMNYESIADGGLFNRDVRWCRHEIERGTVDVLGTDMHRTDFRPPETLNAQKWLKRKLSLYHFDVLTRRNALHIIRNDDIE